MVENLLGDILFIDLTTGQIHTHPYTLDLASRFIGARGYNAQLLWEMVPPHADPLGPENILAFGVGPLTGTNALCSGRTTVTAKGPATGLYLKTNIGGAWGGQIRYAGYSFVVITGRAEYPVYLWIDDDRVTIRDARHLWGMDVRQTEHAIQAELGDCEIKTAVIGPAGENKVMFAAIMCSNYNAAARGGIGAVMGSKNLKALAVRGTHPVQVANPAGFQELVERTWDLYYSQSGVKGTHLFGTSGGVPASNATFTFSAYNFQHSTFEKANKLSGQYLVEAGYLKRRVSCFACPMSCHRYVELDKGVYSGSYTGGPEFETLGAFGSGCGISDTEAIIKANELCNLYGLDTISAGSVIQWAMECHQRNINFDRDGLDLSWGNGKTLVELIHRIAYRQGLGDLLAEGTRKASERVGQGSEDWAIQAKGLEQSRCDTRGSFGYALAFAVNPRGPDHLMTEPLAERGRTPEMIEVIEKITGDKKYANQYMTEKRAVIVRWHEDVYAVTDALGLCAFGSTAQYYLTPSLMADLFSAATGIPSDERSIMLLGRKIVTMERCFNTREGATRKDDVLPKRLMTEESPERRGTGAINSYEVLNPMLDEYYSLHGWDVKSGKPLRSTLESLDLQDWADELEKEGVLP